jgi:MHS family proline/betaine transporter-like MFS transporter
MTRGGWRMVLLASLGGTLEYYDFVVFGIFAREIGQAVFPSGDPLVSLMLAFTTFAVGYLARPIGGLVLGSLGDRFGRRGVFLASIFIASAATLGIGLVPDYATLGIAATVTVVTLRLVQGFCLGGELPGAVTYVVETAPRVAPFVCGVVYACVTLGVAMATGIALVVGRVMSPDDALRYGWRIAFIVGGVLGLAGYWLRRSFEESAEFAELKRIKAVSTRPLRELARSHRWPVAAGMAAQCTTAGFNGLFFAHMPAYLTGVVGYAPRDAVFAQTYAVVLHAVLILAAGWLALRVTPHLLLRAGTLILALGAYPFYAALAGRAVDLMLLMTVAAVSGALVNATFAFVTADLFPTRVRFSGIGLAQNVTQSVFGGTTPLIATALIASLGRPEAPAGYLVACAAVGFASSLAAPRFSRQIQRSAGVVPYASG